MIKSDGYPRGNNRFAQRTGILLWTFIMFALFCPVNAQDYLCGDANGDEAVDVGDVVFLISYVFDGGFPADPLESGDVNGDGYVNVGDVVYLISYIFKGGPAPACEAPSGTLIGHTGCKMFLKGDSIPSDQGCIEYAYDGEGILSLTHINAGFNCCPDTIAAEITISGNSIIINERESLEPGGGCDCLCLFDLDMQISNLKPGEYTIVVNEPYLHAEDNLLEFTINLTSMPSAGQFCVPRLVYPWDDSYAPSGSVTGYTTCKTFEKGTDVDSTPPNQDCMEYEYDGGNALLLTHINAGFNCCASEVWANIGISFEDNLIIIEEGESLDSGACFCLCLFDVDYEITDLPPGEYTIRVIGLNLFPLDDYLEFTVDLLSTPSGRYCKTRTNYPWGP